MKLHKEVEEVILCALTKELENCLRMVELGLKHDAKQRFKRLINDSKHLTKGFEDREDVLQLTEIFGKFIHDFRIELNKQVNENTDTTKGA
jgi:hypothetical protein